MESSSEGITQRASAAAWSRSVDRIRQRTDPGRAVAVMAQI